MAGLFALATIGLPWLGAVCIWLLGDRRTTMVRILAVGFSALTGAASLALLGQASPSAAVRIGLGGVLGDFSLVPDGLGVLIAVVASVIGTLAVIFSLDYMRDHAHQLARFYALILFFIGAMNGLGLSGSLLFTFIFWEITAVCSYLLISFHNDDPKAVAGGIRALIMTQFGGVGLLAGALILYALQGNYEIAEFLGSAAGYPPVVLSVLAFAFLLAAAAKSAQVPLHFWLPDAMEAPTPVTALIHAATMVNAGVYLLARFFPAFAAVPGWRLAVMIVGALSALLAGLMALTAWDVKRVLAFSTISQLGFMVYGVGSGALFASQFHLLSHAIFKALLFLTAGALITALGSRDLKQMGGLAKRLPFLCIAFLAGAFGLAGLPLANGFFSKDLLLAGGRDSGPLLLYALMLLNSGLTAGYTLRLFWLIFGGPRRGPQPAHDGLPWMRLALSVLAAGTFTSWLLAGPLGRLLADTLPSHHVEAKGLAALLSELLSDPGTWAALASAGIGMALWAARGRFTRFSGRLAFLPVQEFGFDRLQDGIVTLVRSAAARLARLQTGQLNWNTAGIVTGLVIVLVLLAGAG